MLHLVSRSVLARCLAALALAFAFGTAHAAPKLLPSAQPTNCAACHGADKVLPAQHPAIKGQKLADCQQCHGTPERSLKLSLSHKHMLAGATCESCHGKGRPALPESSDKCRGCHDVKALVAKTEAVKPRNPHNSPHYGTDIDCDTCHVAHGKPRDYCSQCHDFKFRVP
jgi:hypothetical protein